MLAIQESTTTTTTSSTNQKVELALRVLTIPLPPLVPVEAAEEIPRPSPRQVVTREYHQGYRLPRQYPPTGVRGLDGNIEISIPSLMRLPPFPGILLRCILE
jgi:hypothetical protein